MSHTHRTREAGRRSRNFLDHLPRARRQARERHDRRAHKAALSEWTEGNLPQGLADCDPGLAGCDGLGDRTQPQDSEP